MSAQNTGAVQTKDMTVGRKQSPQEGLQHLLQTCLYRAGLNAELYQQQGDDEVLHQYRVALRRARSLLKAHQPWLVSGDRKALNQSLKALMAQSGELRDWDVVIADLPTWQPYLAECTEDGVKVLIGELKRKRARQLRRLHQHWQSQDYQSVWPLAEQQIAQLGWRGEPRNFSKQLRRRAKGWQKRINKRQAKINKLDWTELHQLRITYKQLRYLQQAYGDWLNKPLLASSYLKTAQDLLGKMNDHRNQQRLLLEHLACKSGGGRDVKSVCLALGALVQAMEQARTSLRQQLKETLTP